MLPAGKAGRKPIIAVYILEVARMIVAAQFVVTGQAEQALLWRVAGLGEDEHAVVAEAEVRPVVIAALLLRTAVVDADHPIGFERERGSGRGRPRLPPDRR